jgi:hypothetical protein
MWGDQQAMVVRRGCDHDSESFQFRHRMSELNIARVLIATNSHAERLLNE